MSARPLLLGAVAGAAVTAGVIGLVGTAAAAPGWSWWDRPTPTRTTPIRPASDPVPTDAARPRAEPDGSAGFWLHCTGTDRRGGYYCQRTDRGPADPVTTTTTTTTTATTTTTRRHHHGGGTTTGNGTNTVNFG